MTDRFLICLPYTLKQEGGNSNDPHDPGGRTHEGITQREYDKYRASKGLVLQTVYRATDAEVQEIYRDNYWLPHCPTLPAGLDLAFFDQAVNEGPFEAIKLLQRALEVTPDGQMGPMTMLALKGSDTGPLIRSYSYWREAYYHSLRTFQYFGTGWIRRTEDIEKVALTMVVSPLDAALDDFTNNPPKPIMKDAP